MNAVCFGIDILTKKLGEVLNNHIRKCLPSIKSKINDKISELNSKLKLMGKAIPDETNEKRIFFLDLIRKFSSTYNNLVMGCYDAGEFKNKNQNKKYPGHEILENFDNLFESIEKISGNLTREEIRKAIDIHEGESLPGFHSIDAFLYLLQPLLEKFRQPANRCVEDTEEILLNISKEALKTHVDKFPIIEETLNQIISDFLRMVMC